MKRAVEMANTEVTTEQIEAAWSLTVEAAMGESVQRSQRYLIWG